MGSEETSKKRRAPNWSSDEVVVLTDTILPHFNTLFGAHSKTITEDKKKAVWAVITKTINEISQSRGGEKRTTSALKKKWTEVKSKAKQAGASAIREQRKTGGGETDEEHNVTPTAEKLLCLSSMNKNIVDKLGLTAIGGIDGGLDSCCVSPTSATFFEPFESNYNVACDGDSEDVFLTPPPSVLPLDDIIEVVDSPNSIAHGQDQSNLPNVSTLQSPPVLPAKPIGHEIRLRKRTTAANEVNKVGKDLLGIEQKKMEIQINRNLYLKRICESLEQLVNYKKQKYQ